MELLKQLTGTNDVALAVLVLSIIAVTGLLISTLKVRGVGLGITGVLFSGLFFGHLGWHINDEVLQFVKESGLILFVFTIGLQIGPGFFASLKEQGLPTNLCASVIVLGGAALTVFLGWMLHINPFAAAGLFSGATTNTPSLGAAQQAITILPLIDPSTKALPALAYAVAYPGGVLGIILALILLKVIFRIRPDSEVAEFEESRKCLTPPLQRRSLTVANPNLNGLLVRDIPTPDHANIVISRIQSPGGGVRVVSLEESVHVGDIILAVGTEGGLDDFQRIVGGRSEANLLDSTSSVHYRRIIVTRKEPLGKSLRQLALHTTYGVIVTRIQRGDVEMPGDADMKLQFGDTLQVVGDTQGLDQAAALLGNSAKELGITHYLPVFIGLALGVAAGLLPLALPGLPVPVRLGLAGGPLVIAIILSRIGRIGPLVWYMPSGANLALRELGIILFLACVGLKAGAKFIPTLMSPQGVTLLAAGFCITLIPLVAVGIVARLLLKMNYVTLCGLIAGSMTDPPALAFANSMVKSDGASVSYAAVYPLTMLLRILCAQVLVLLFS
ncbi:MAG: putative transporter [Verrucomicrobia bacterium]|jgi:putative transport protein|nr:putative transporter [Verrucomicrobiota bacterium]